MKVYFLGIAGAGVSALASVLASEGHEVTGSDEGVFPPVSTYLDQLGVRYHDGFDALQVPPDIDLAIIGASAKLHGNENLELAAIRRLDVPTYTFPEYLGIHTRGRENLVIAGSFGKSTLTALCAHLLRSAGRDPGYFVGAIPLDLPTTGHNGSDPEFILEGDEYVISNEDRRSKFVLYHPRATLISSIVHDHVNMFPTMDAYVKPFSELVHLTPEDGLLVCAHNYPIVHDITRDRRVVWYGVGFCPGYYASDIVIGEVTRFNLYTPDGRVIPLETEMLGYHNVENIVGAAALLMELGLLNGDALQSGVRRFRGVSRRLDKKTVNARVPAYEGFGSSYEKARSAIDAIRLHFPDRPMVVVFEPHTFSWRNQDALTWYDTVFQGVEQVLLLPPPVHGAQSHAQLTQDQIVARVRATGVTVNAVMNADDVLATFDHCIQGNEVVLLLSSGPLDGLASSAPQWLERHFS